jgi:Leucine-rich repeat (LRR) protein
VLFLPRSLSSLTPLEWLYTCESFNMKVMIDDVKVLSIYGEHNGTMTNDDVMVFSNVFTKTNYLPTGLAKMFPKLERFYVASSRLKYIFRKNFVGFNKLKTLDLRYNEIESLSTDAFLDLFNLEVLTISGNFIKKLPTNAFVSLMDLKYFDASDNEIEEFDDEVFSLSLQLEEILLDNNKINSIKANFRKLKSVGFIDLRDNECIDSFFLRDHPGYPSIYEFQKEINSNCTIDELNDTNPTETRVEHRVLQWDICPRLMHPINMLCLIERKFMGEVKV